MARSTPPASTHGALLPRHAWRVIGAAFGAGLLLFVLVWLGARDQAPAPLEAAATGEPDARLPPLPRPLPAGDGASDMPDAGAPGERPRLVEIPPEPLPPPLPQDPATQSGAGGPGPADAAASGGPLPPSGAGAQPLPLADQSPSPRYPGAALRRRDQGTVVLRVDVDSSGRPAGVTLVQRSGSRDLDRAAQEAVRQWRFQPAVVDGQPVPGSVEIPIDFRLD